MQNKNQKEEEDVRDFLSIFFPKISFQLYIKYKEAQNVERIGIIDLMVSDKNIVYLIEIKRHNIYIDKNQLELYHDLITYLMNINNDTRELKSLFIVNDYYYSIYNFNKCVQFNNIKIIQEKSKIMEEFEKMIFKIKK